MAPPIVSPPPSFELLTSDEECMEAAGLSKEMPLGPGLSAGEEPKIEYGRNMFLYTLYKHGQLENTRAKL